ncbi:hypothetical protein K9K77_00875 [Candidatus Babeliales bacterium]|nr:hypothetical protein [Candidatus Babeliales bacterium]
MMFVRGIIVPLLFVSFFSFSFYFPSCFFILPFFFLVPLFYTLSCFPKYAFLQGWVGGTLFFMIHMFGFWWVSFFYGVGFLRIIYPFILFMYCGLYTGVWFFLLCTMNIWKRWQKRIGWFIVSLGYFWIIDSKIFIVFGAWEGYSLAFPLIPLVHIPYCLRTIWWVGPWVLLSIIIVFQILLSEFLKKRDFQKVSSLIIGMSLFFFIIPEPIIKNEKNIQNIFHHIVALPLPKKDNPYEMAQEMCLSLMNAVHNNKDATIFIFPESAFPFVLSDHPYALKMWNENVLEANKILIMGSHTKKPGKLFNSFIVVRQCRIIEYYSKKHLVPFFEHIPWFYQSINSCSSLFLTQKERFYSGKSDQTPLYLDSFSFIPVICSELFFSLFTGVSSEIPLICLMNDSYFKGSGYSKIMLNSARFACFRQKKILAYIASDAAYVITPFKTLDKFL